MRAIARRRHDVVDQQPMDPDDDPYAAYLIWKAEREAEAAGAGMSEDGEACAVPPMGAEAEACTVPALEEEPVRGSWLRRLAARAHVNAARGR